MNLTFKKCKFFYRLNSDIGLLFSKMSLCNFFIYFFLVTNIIYVDTDRFTGSKSSKLSREKAEKARLQGKYKKEMKGALREIRRDKAYIASVKIRQKIHRYIFNKAIFKWNLLQGYT